MTSSHTFYLPQLSVQFPHRLPQEQYLLVTGGRPPAEKWLQTVAANRILWAVDHGLDSCKAAKLIPRRLIGDGDSAAADTWHWAEALHIPIEKFSPKKDYTDTQLALSFLKKEQISPFVLLTGALGARLDHTFSTLLSFGFSGLPGAIADEQESCFFLHNQETLQFSIKKRPKAISLLSLSSSCQGVSITNMYWPLQNATIQQGFPAEISNELLTTATTFYVSLKKGCLCVYLYWG